MIAHAVATEVSPPKVTCDRACTPERHAPRCPNNVRPPDKWDHTYHYVLRCACDRFLGSCGCGNPDKVWIEVTWCRCST